MASSENSHIFIWKDFNEWRPVLEGMFKDILTPELKAKLKKNRAIVEYCDDPEPFEKLAEQSIKAMITTEKINEFRQLYSHIRVYHGCRPVDVQNYYEKGILPSITLKDAQVARFREIFLSGRFPELTEEMLQQSIERVVKKDEDLCLEIDDKALLKHSGHYLIYGSEYLENLVSNLPIENSREKYLPVLRKIGKPTMFEINLPNTNEYVDDYGDIRYVIYRMIPEWASCLTHSRTKSCLMFHTFSLTKPLPPEHIFKDYNPRKITDSLMGYKIYDAWTGEYEDAT